MEKKHDDNTGGVSIYSWWGDCPANFVIKALKFKFVVEPWCNVLGWAILW